MRSRYLIHEPDRAHFITCTIVEWLPVFNSAACCEIVVNSLAYCQKQKGLKIYAWVILDNHLHAILAALDLSSVLRDFKSFTALKIIEQLGLENRHWLLNQLGYYCSEHKSQRYQIWQEGSHPQSIQTDEVMLQKLNYLHHNPVKRSMVVAPEHWRYSSAHLWLPGAQPLLHCDDWR